MIYKEMSQQVRFSDKAVFRLCFQMSASGDDADVKSALFHKLGMVARSIIVTAKLRRCSFEPTHGWLERPSLMCLRDAKPTQKGAVENKCSLYRCAMIDRYVPFLMDSFQLYLSVYFTLLLKKLIWN